MIEDPNDNWLEDDERKDQREYKTSLIHAMIETISIILKNDKIRNLHLDSDSLNIFIEAFVWANKYKSQPQPYPKIFELCLNIL